ncbi:hypothetical protein [Bacteroides gallinarum]|uniref:hypothetical protein n=1 Tax=Bacteroides gallinarum TaxID=376806 RepID=UPI000AD094EF|nr:hypothetical protein [Bacteroides gallinarum]
MAQEQNYQVNYSINVDASAGTKQVIAFGEAVGKLVQAKASLTPAVNNIKSMMDEIDRVFRTKNGKRRNFDYRLTIETGMTEEKLIRVKNLLTEIGTLSKGINLVINAGQPLDSKGIKAKAKSLYEKKAAELRKTEIENTAASSVRSVLDAQKQITKVIGKINSALVSLGKGKEVDIRTDAAKGRLQEILSLLERIKGAARIPFSLQGSGLPAQAGAPVAVPYALPAYALPEKAQQRLAEQLYVSQQKHRQKLAQADELFEMQQRQRGRQTGTEAEERRQKEQARREEQERRNAAKAAERLRKQAEAARVKAEKEAREEKQRNAVQAIRQMQAEQSAAGTLHRSKRRAAINRIQYSRAPSLRDLPFATMLNAYMGYSLLRSNWRKPSNTPT